MDVLFEDYEFVLSADQEIKKGKNKGKTWSPISFVPVFKQDGAEKSDSQRLLLCNADAVDATVSEDGKTVTFGEGTRIFADNETMIFIQSLVDGGFPEDQLDDDPNVLNLEPAIGARLRLIQEVNAEKTKMQGKQKNDKTGKEYDRRDLKVQTVIAMPTAKSKAGKPAVKGGKAAKPADVSVLAAETLTTLLQNAKDNTLAKKALKMKAFGLLGTKHAQLNDVTKLFADDDFLATVDGVEFDGEAVTLVA